MIEMTAVCSELLLHYKTSAENDLYPRIDACYAKIHFQEPGLKAELDAVQRAVWSRDKPTGDFLDGVLDAMDNLAIATSRILGAAGYNSRK
ncbi:hypothetical protein KPaMU14_04875 [Kocuria palustris]|nr:hypothetical protein KPaMU14_04875 [Kocuria palustris]